MGLKDGSLDSLVRNGCDAFTTDRLSVAETVFRQMLEALDCLSFHGIVHRDVKPQNILYTSQPNGKFEFQLGDFGLCNLTANAETKVGTPIFMAPEILHGRQSSKSDVWSLFVTMLWTLGVPQFREGGFKSSKHIWDAVLDAAGNSKEVSRIRDMVIVNVDERASAAQILVKEFNSSGLTTPLKHVPSLAIRPFPSTACAEDLSRIMSPIQPLTTQDQPMVIEKNETGFSPAQSTRASPRNTTCNRSKPTVRSRERKPRSARRKRNVIPKTSSRQEPCTNYSSKMDISLI